MEVGSTFLQAKAKHAPTGLLDSKQPLDVLQGCRVCRM
jgi:hypothetical protein